MVGLRLFGRLRGVEIRRCNYLPYTDNEGNKREWIENPNNPFQFFVSVEMFDKLAAMTEPQRERFVD